MIRKIVALLCLTASAGYAQTVEHLAVASQFNNWRAYGSTNLSVGANPLTPITPCLVQGDPNHQIFALQASTPIKIYDPGNPAIDETITPTVIVAGSTCTATFTVANAHPTPWYIGSGSFGLQEAINAWQATGQFNVVELDSLWHSSGGGALQIQNAVGTGPTPLLDVSVTPNIAYKWTGTHYQPTYSLNGIANPTIAAGAAAGTSPTVSNVAASSGNSMTANVTTGTATTTGTLFTETVTASTGNLNCTIQSVGANNFPVPITVTGTSTTLVTFSVAVAPPISTAYVFNVECN